MASASRQFALKMADPCPLKSHFVLFFLVNERSGRRKLARGAKRHVKACEIPTSPKMSADGTLAPRRTAVKELKTKTCIFSLKRLDSCPLTDSSQGNQH